MIAPIRFSFFFFNDTATTEIYTLSLHDALPICQGEPLPVGRDARGGPLEGDVRKAIAGWNRRLRNRSRSEEHTSELQSQSNLVCRLLLEKKKKIEYMILHMCDRKIMTVHTCNVP